MSAIGADLIAESLLRFNRGEISPAPQDEKDVSYAPILKKEDGRIDWALPARTRFTTACAASRPGPARTPRFESKRANSGAAPAAPSTEWTQFATGEIIHTTTDLYVVCGEGTCLRLEAVQIEGRKKISARQFANGARLAADDGFD